MRMTVDTGPRGPSRRCYTLSSSLPRRVKARLTTTPLRRPSKAAGENQGELQQRMEGGLPGLPKRGGSSEMDFKGLAAR